MFGKILDFLDKILTFFEEWTLFVSVIVALIALLLGDLGTAFGMPLLLSYALAMAALYAIVRFAGRPNGEVAVTTDRSATIRHRTLPYIPC